MTKISDLYSGLPDAFSLKHIKEAYSGEITARSINRIIRGYVARGMLAKLKNDAYAKVSANQYLVAGFLYRGYIGFSSALYLHGLKTEVEDLITICTGKTDKPRTFAGTKLVPVFFTEFFYGTEIVSGILVSTYAKTLFDMLYKPKYASFFDFYRAINQRKPAEEEWKELMGYLEEASTATVRRAGYVLDGFAPKWFIDRLGKLDSRIGKSFFSRKVTLNLSKKWLIYDDINARRWENAV